jgi:hypothetical protein
VCVGLFVQLNYFFDKLKKKLAVLVSPMQYFRQIVVNIEVKTLNVGGFN